MLSSVGLTSRWMAAARARESTRADRLFDDPFAAALAGPDGLAWLRTMDLAATTLGAGPGLFSIIRTRFFDDYLTSVMSQSRVRQIVLLAAGMDTRAFRMEWPPGTRLYELDLPEVLGAKEKLLSGTTASETCERRTVCADLAGDSWPGIPGRKPSPKPGIARKSHHCGSRKASSCTCETLASMIYSMR